MLCSPDSPHDMGMPFCAQRRHFFVPVFVFPALKPTFCGAGMGSSPLGRGRGRGRAREGGHARHPPHPPEPPRIVLDTTHHGAAHAVTYWNVTISSSKRAIPLFWLERLHAWAAVACNQAIFVVEIGRQHCNPHIQGTFNGPWNTSAAAVIALRSSIRTACLMQLTGYAKITVREFEGPQAWREMLGYCLKDITKPHFRMEVHNISDEELQAARAAYGCWAVRT